MLVGISTVADVYMVENGINLSAGKGLDFLNSKNVLGCVIKSTYPRDIWLFIKQNALEDGPHIARPIYLRCGGR